MQQAAVAVVLRPAPHLKALREKIAVIRAHQLHDPDDGARDFFRVLEQDVKLLSASLVTAT